MSLRNKRILISAGPTWVPIDSVRVLGNTASGETGILLADKLAGEGARVTLILGPSGMLPANKKVKVIRFHFFAELKKAIFRQLKAGRFDAFVHSAAVSDYLPEKIFPGKVGSGLKKWNIVLKPAPKLIDLVKKTAPGLFLVGFKFEPGAGRARLICEARALMLRAKLDLAVANTVSGGKYRAYVLSNNTISPVLTGKGQLTVKLVNEIKKAL